jgi:hypothetical protein
MVYFSLRDMIKSMKENMTLFLLAFFVSVSGFAQDSTQLAKNTKPYVCDNLPTFFQQDSFPKTREFLSNSCQKAEINSPASTQSYLTEVERQCLVFDCGLPQKVDDVPKIATTWKYWRNTFMGPYIGLMNCEGKCKNRMILFKASLMGFIEAHNVETHKGKPTPEAKSE